MFTAKELSSKNVSTRNILAFHLKSQFFHAQNEMAKNCEQTIFRYILSARPWHNGAAYWTICNNRTTFRKYLVQMVFYADVSIVESNQNKRIFRCFLFLFSVFLVNHTVLYQVPLLSAEKLLTPLKRKC